MEFKSYPSCSIIILNYNNRPILEKCLPSVIATKYNGPIEIIVIDNGSTDDSVSFIQNCYPKLKLICFKENFGFAPAYNRVIPNCQSELICFLNNDVEVSGNYLEIMANKLLSDEKIASVMPKMLYYYDKSIINAAGTICDIFGLAFNRGISQKDKGQFDRKTEIFYACGACVLIRKKTFETVGFFDETYFMYNEDVDLSWRLRLMGYKIIYVPEATVFHIHMAGTLSKDKLGNKIFEWEKNRLITFIKNYSILTIAILGPLLCIILSIHMLYALIKGKPKESRMIIKALYWNLKHFPQIWKKRKTVQQNRVVSDFSVMRVMAKNSFEIGLGLGLAKHPLVHSKNKK